MWTLASLHGSLRPRFHGATSLRICSCNLWFYRRYLFINFLPGDGISWIPCDCWNNLSDRLLLPYTKRAFYCRHTSGLWGSSLVLALRWRSLAFSVCLHLLVGWLGVYSSRLNISGISDRHHRVSVNRLLAPICVSNSVFSFLKKQPYLPSDLR